MVDITTYMLKQLKLVAGEVVKKPLFDDRIICKAMKRFTAYSTCTTANHLIVDR